MRALGFYKKSEQAFKACSDVCQDVSDDKKSPWCIALHTIYTITSYLLVHTRF